MIPTQNEKLLKMVSSAIKPDVVKVEKPKSNFPELIVTVPDSWPTITLAPLYDVHLGHDLHDKETFQRHLSWIVDTPHLLTWNGGDMIENASKDSVGAGVYDQEKPPQGQMVDALLALAKIRHKMLFALPGNHEDRANIAGLDLGQWLAIMLNDLPYFPDYCFLTLKWRKNNFRLLAHHGTGSAQTAGAQRMAGRKDISWAKPFDLFWTGHLHNELVDTLYQTDVNQKTGERVDRVGMVIISPSYLKYFGSYAAKKRYPPGRRGLTSVTLRDDGRIDAIVHTNGKRL